MNAEAIRTWIVQTLEGVEGIGRVHAHERYAKREQDLVALYGVAASPGRREARLCTGGSCAGYRRRASGWGARAPGGCAPCG